MATDPAPRCYFCGRLTPEIREQGCGSQEFPKQDRVNELCEVYQQARRGRCERDACKVRPQAQRKP